MSEKNSAFPFQHLGRRLKIRREKIHESLGEVSGAVEIDIDTLSQIEAGAVRPSEDILSLLISYLDITEDEASKLWDLASYDAKRPAGVEQIMEDLAGKQVFMMVPFDTRTVYSDASHSAVNKHGVVLTFLQAGGPHNQSIPVARVGMSREHAQNMLAMLQASLEQLGKPPVQKSLPAPRDKKDSPRESN